MSRLSQAEREKTAVIKVKRKTKTRKVVTDYKFPIPDKAHAKAALARLDQAKPPLTPKQKAEVRRKAYAKLGVKKGGK
jgi:hypothetical protein